MRVWSSGAGVALALVASQALAQPSPEPETCAVKLNRWTEDCRNLADSPRTGLEALRYVPLAADGAIWLTVGGEFRTRAEGLDSVDFGIGDGPDYGVLAYRSLLHADLRTQAGPRLFVQLSAAGQDGREPGPRAFDESDPDLAQAFVDVPVQFDGGSVSLRLGRQELSLNNRLVALRDGVTLRRAFDGARVDVEAHGWAVTGFYVSPVLNQPDAFDDRTTPGETFGGVSIALPHEQDGPVWSLFAFERSRRLARYASAVGEERRQSYGFRYAADGDRSDLEVQIVAQTGEVGEQGVSAWGMAVDYGWRPSPGSPTRIGAEFSVASGDGDAGDGELNTFDPLYPNLGAFGDAPLYYYANQINAQVNAQRRFGAVTLQADVTLTGRYDTSDAIYTSPGRPLATPPSGDRLSAVLLEASARWSVRPGVELYTSILRAEALDGIRNAGGDDVAFGLVQLTAAF